MQKLIGPRIAQQLVGVGLLEAVPDTVILANADPNDENGDGLQNQILFYPESKKELEKFGWKANEANLKNSLCLFKRYGNHISDSPSRRFYQASRR